MRSHALKGAFADQSQLMARVFADEAACNAMIAFHEYIQRRYSDLGREASGQLDDPHIETPTSRRNAKPFGWAPHGSSRLASQNEAEFMPQRGQTDRASSYCIERYNQPPPPKPVSRRKVLAGFSTSACAS